MWREGKPKRQSEKCEVSGIFQRPRRFHFTNSPTHGRNRNFCLFVAKKGKVHFHRITDPHNMVTGNGLTTGHVDRTMPLAVDSNTMRNAGHKVGLSVRTVAKLCGVMESQVPVGYEDKGGFHYGANFADSFFSF